MPGLNLAMFRAYDIRTPRPRLTLTLARRLLRAEAAYFKEVVRAPGVLLAHDAREGGPAFLRLALEEFSRAGLEAVWIPCACSAPMFYFAAMKFPRLGGILFGASHNPPQDTGQKIVAPGLRPVARGLGPKGGLDLVQEMYRQGAAAPKSSSPGRQTVFDPCPEYVEYSMKLAGVKPGGLKGARVLHDYLNGAAAREMLLAFSFAGAGLTPLHSQPDGSFPLGAPNPVIKEVIQPGLDVLNHGGYHLGMFFDGDGDRMDVYGGDGAYLASSFVYAGILPEIKKNFSGAGLGVYADLKCNPLALMEMAKAGLTTRVIRNGHSQIKAALYQDPSMIGAVEESAHFYQAFTFSGRRYAAENSLYTALLAAKLAARRPAAFRALFRAQAQAAREREWGYKFGSVEGMKKAFVAVEAHFARMGAGALNHMENGWPLDGMLMRLGLPFEIGPSTRPAEDWLQVCFRPSHSEDRLARFEVVSAWPALAAQAKADIAKIAKRHGAGKEYQG